MAIFKNREEAGHLLAAKLQKEKISTDFIVGIPRGGVVIARIIADELHLPLTVVVVKKIGAPDNPELAIGAVGAENVVFWDEKLVTTLGVTSEQRQNLLAKKEKERKDREEFLNIQFPYIEQKTVVVVDDGVATGATSIVAGLYLKEKKANSVILATPVVAKDTLRVLQKYFDKIVYLASPKNFSAVGQFYKEFPQVDDKEVLNLLKQVKNSKS